LSRILSWLKQDGMKKSSVTAHAASRAKPGGGLAWNHCPGGEVYLDSSDFSEPSDFLVLPSLSVFLDESEQLEESSDPQ